MTFWVWGYTKKKHLQHFFSQTQNKKTQKDSKKLQKSLILGYGPQGQLKVSQICVFIGIDEHFFCCQDYLLVFQTFGVTKESWDHHMIPVLYLPFTTNLTKYTILLANKDLMPAKLKEIKDNKSKRNVTWMYDGHL